MRTRIRLALGASLGMSLVPVLGLYALATGTVDQSIGATAPFDSMSWVYSAQGGGQSFTAGLTGPLDAVTIFLKDGGNATAGLTVTVKAAAGGLPIGSTLATEFIPDSAVPSVEGAVTVNFATPTTVIAGQQYAILITTTAGASGNQHYELYYKTSTVYSGGTALDDRGANSSWRDLGFDNSLLTYVTQNANGSSGASTPAIPDVFQAIGAPAHGDCSNIAMTHLDWASVATGGWHRSWAQWVNGGRGGLTCERVLHYNGSTWGHL